MHERWLTDFTQYIRFEKRYSRHTLLAYQKDISSFFEFLFTTFSFDDPKEVAHFHIRTWLAQLKDNKQLARTINRKISSLTSFYKYLLRQGLVDKNPVRQLHAMRMPERLPAYLKETETEELLQEVQFDEGFKGFTDRLICDILYQAGLRRSELIQLKEADIEWSLHQLRILGKGNKERLLPVSDELLKDIREYISEKKRTIEHCDRKHLLVLDSGRPLYAGYVYRIVNRYLSGLTTLPKKSPHILRHTFATHLLNNGANIQAIKDLLGHSSLAATQIYTHNNIDKLKEIHKLSHPRG
ncbi:MAG: tyrosine-type recombinase/integrase [Taibaiella sp.]|nr:tyrosine-type recombinase/integrase [Taibaiella sp.]